LSKKPFAGIPALHKGHAYLTKLQTTAKSQNMIKAIEQGIPIPLPSLHVAKNLLTPLSRLPSKSSNLLGKRQK
jgi:hypothetical protein